MGCGASVDKGSRPRFGKRGKKGSAPLAPQPYQADDIVVTPPGTTRDDAEGEPPARQNLRIETTPVPAVNRRDFGLAVTPVGKQAEEFRFFCPVCMMFYRSILEVRGSPPLL